MLSLEFESPLNFFISLLLQDALQKFHKSAEGNIPATPDTSVAPPVEENPSNNTRTKRSFTVYHR